MLFPSSSRVPLIAMALLLSGCAAALSSSQPAHVPEKGHVQAEVGGDIAIPLGTIDEAVDAAEALESAAEQRTLSEDEKREIIEGAAHLAFNPPAFIPHVGVAYAPWEKWEGSVRFAGNGWRVGVRRQLVEQKDAGVDLTVGLGVGRAAFEPPVDSVLDTVEISDFVRWTFDVPIAVGQHEAWYRWWAGPRVLMTFMNQDVTLTLPGEEKTVAEVSARGFYAGAYGGVALGYRWIFFGPELTLVQLFSKADLSLLDTETSVDLDSFIVYPSLVVMGEF